MDAFAGSSASGEVRSDVATTPLYFLGVLSLSGDSGGPGIPSWSVDPLLHRHVMTSFNHVSHFHFVFLDVTSAPHHGTRLQLQYRTIQLLVVQLVQPL